MTKFCDADGIQIPDPTITASVPRPPYYTLVTPAPLCDSCERRGSGWNECHFYERLDALRREFDWKVDVVVARCQEYKEKE